MLFLTFIIIFASSDFIYQLWKQHIADLNMAETTTLCVSVQAGEHLLSGPDWLKIEDNRTLVDVLVEVSGRQALGYQVQVIVSKEPSFTEAALMKILNCVSTLRTSGNIYVKFLLKSSVLPSQVSYTFIPKNAKVC